MKLSKLFLSVGTSMAIILGAGRLFNHTLPDYYFYLGMLVVCFIVISVGIRSFEKKRAS
ncbi:cation transport ATPase [Paenibacillus castaneae]|uniref:hypothetical protein n=1 Tax=Paenibacillus castaneae TaxID=474957 RepID=UPI00141B91F3|nr:hypothetical protein [Paenibacillus castaneae]NIK77828.1 cation transport ATPase [Paenibacillus castaneae]